MIGIRNVLLAAAVGCIAVPAAPTAAEESWFVQLERHTVAAGVKRKNVSLLVDVGSVETDGYSQMMLSLGGEFKEGIPSTGSIGALLIPDHEIFDFLLRTEGVFVFPIEIKFEAQGLNRNIFISESMQARVAFPRYRVYLYNETDSGASVSLFIYRTRN